MIFYYEVDLYSKDLCFNNFNYYFSFWICTVNRSRKIGALHPCDRKYFSVKTVNA